MSQLTAQQNPAAGSSSAPQESAPQPPRRGRGRPRKTHPQEGEPAAERPPRGRPTKKANRSLDPEDKSPEANIDPEEEEANRSPEASPGNAMIVSTSKDGGKDGSNDDVSKDGSKDVRKDGSKDDGKSISQCAPWTFCKEILTPLLKDKEVLKLIDKIPFKTLFGMKSVHPKKKLMEFMIGCFCEESRSFVINEEHIDVKKLVQKVIGLSNCGKDIAIDPHYTGHSELRGLLTANGRCLYAKNGYKFLNKKEGLDDLSRCIVFILEACAYFLAPRSNRTLERDFLSIFKDVETLDDIKNMKWCDFIGEFLIEGLIEYKRGNKKCHGCVYILAVIFYDLVTPNIKILDKRFPRINHITQAEMDTLDVDDLENIAKTAKLLSQSIYSQDYQVEEVARPDASMTSLLKELDELTSNLVHEVSAPPEEEVKMISDLKDNKSNKSFKSKLTSLEKQLKKQRASISQKTKKLQKLHKNLADLLKVPEN